MTDERDLHELAAPLLADPPHPPPPLDELERRVGRRRQRRARAIGLCSVVAVVLVAAGVLALPRDPELQVGDGTAATPTTQPPPPLEAGLVRIQMAPESAPLGAYRIATITNGSTERYLTCGYAYDLFRWTGDDWEPAATTWLGDNKTILGEFDPDRPEGDCGYSTIPPGETHTLPFDPIAADWYSPDGNAVMPPDLLTVGWYEVREPAYDGAPLEAVGRFEVTPPGADTDPPIVGPAPIQVAVTPEVAPLDTVRTVEVRNTSDLPYTECGLRYDLHRWDGSQWQAVATMNLAIEPDGYPASGLAPFVVEYNENPPSPALIQCAAMTTIEPGSSRRVTVNFADFADHDGAGSIPPAAVDPLPSGVYELRSFLGAGSDLTALGRFEITAPAVEPTESTVTTAGGQTSETVGGISVEGSVDVWPGGGLQPVGAQLPEQLIAVDDDTIALAWRGPCNRPATRDVEVVGTAEEVEVRLHVASTPQACSSEASDRWVLTTDLGGVRIGTRRLVARASGTAGEVEVPATPTIRASAQLTENGTLPAATPISFQVPSSFFGGAAALTIPAPLLTSDHACAVATYEIDGTYVPMVRMGSPIAEPDFESCTTAAIMIVPDDRLFGAG